MLVANLIDMCFCVNAEETQKIAAILGKDEDVLSCEDIVNWVGSLIDKELGPSDTVRIIALEDDEEELPIDETLA